MIPLRIDLLILTVIIAGGHGQEKPVHAARALTTQDLETGEELTEVFVHSDSSGHRTKEEVFQSGHGKAERGKAQFVGKSIPLRQRQRTHLLIPAQHCVEPFDRVRALSITQGIHRRCQVVNELPLARRLEVEYGGDPASTKEQIVGK